MWTIIGVAVPVVLAMYGLARLQQKRNNHGAQGPAGSANSRRADSYIPARLYKADSYNHDDPNLPFTAFPATTLQSAEEKEEAARKYLVKWDSDEELERGSNVGTLIDAAPTSQDVEEKKPSDRHKQGDVKWDAFEEK
jgi:hypothetical protein